MNFTFSVNSYLLAWYLLFKDNLPLTPSFKKFRLKLFNDYPKEYGSLLKEKSEIILKKENFIPSNDLLYDKIFKTEEFKNYLEESNSYAIFLRELWKQNKARINEELRYLIKYKVKDDYNVICFPPNFMINDYEKTEDDKVVLWGLKRLDKEDNFYPLILLSLKCELDELEVKNSITLTVLDLLVNNELRMRLSGDNLFNKDMGSNFKRKLKYYPYFLKYLKMNDEEIKRRSERDGIALYPYDDVDLSNLDLKGFVKYLKENEIKFI